MVHQLLNELLHHKHLICVSQVSSLYFSILSSSQIVFSRQMLMLAVVDTFEIMDQNEDVALECSIWIEGNDGFFS